MDSQRYTYRISLIFSGVMIWEILFWFIFGTFLYMMGYWGQVTGGIQLDFKNPSAALLLVVLVPMIGIYFWFLKWKNERYRKLGNTSVHRAILVPISSLQTFMKFFLFRNTIVFIILAMMQPVFGSQKVASTKESMDLIVALDISSSMNVQDIDNKTSRLDIAKRAMIQLINHLHGERLGIVVFAGNAYVQLPLTIDYEAAKMYVNEIETGMISEQGTNLAAALSVAKQMFPATKTSKAILMISDAEDHEGGLIKILSQLKENQIELSILGIGTTTGGMIPNNPFRAEFGHKLDEKGMPVISRMNPTLIKQIARQVAGTYRLTENAYPDLSELLQKIKHMKRQKVNSMEFDVKENRYQFPLFLAIISWFLFVIWPKNTATMLDKWMERKTNQSQ
jgi:Ca-activated chloride channel family protein